MSHRDGQPNTTLVKVRLVTTYYRNRLEWEDGPGSLRNVVSDDSKEYTALGEMTQAEAEALTQSDLEVYHAVYFENDSADGFEEYWYALEYFDADRQKWRYLKTVK